MVKQVSVSIIIPNMNGKDYLQRCLESIMDSTVQPTEIIVVDNASTDGSLELLEREFPSVIRIANKVNSGFTGAVNAGISKSNGRYVFLLNNDTLVDKRCIENLIEAIEIDPKVFSAGALMLRMDKPSLVDDAGDRYNILGYARAIGSGQSIEKYRSEKSVSVFSVSAGAALYKKEILDKIGLFNDQHFAYLEDVDIGYRARIYGYRNVSVRNALVYHKGSATSGSKHNAFKVSLSSKNSVLVPISNMPFIQYVFNLPFLLLGYLIKLLFFTGKGYGKEYFGGIIKGLQCAFSKDGRKHHVRFRFRFLIQYLKVQLWMLRCLMP